MRNVCGPEKWIRGIAGLIPLALYITGILEGAWGMVATILGCILLITALSSYCPVNALLGITSCKNKKKAEELPPGVNQIYQNPQANDGYVSRRPD